MSNKSFHSRQSSPLAAQIEGSPARDLARPFPKRANGGAFTIVEAVVALSVLMIFFLGSTAALNLFDTRAAQNRNAEAARAIVDDYVYRLLDDNIQAPTAATAAGADLDGDGIPDGVVCTNVVGGDHNGDVPNPVALVETRTTAPTAVVSGTLYWRVQAVGTSMGLPADTDLMQVNFTLSYVYRNKTYYYHAMTYKARSS